MTRVSALDMPDVPKGQLPEHLETQRTRVVCKADAPIHTEGIQYSGAFSSMGVDNSLRISNFCEKFKVKVIRLTDDTIEFDMVGMDAPLANAFRRILIAEIPTMAIEKVLVVNNTSVIAEEVLAHRLGLIPLDADPRLFEMISENDTPNENNTIVFKLNVSCPREGPRLSVKSDQLKWLPNGSELMMESPNPSAKPKSYTSFSCSQDSMEKFKKKPPGLKHHDIVITRLGPGQEVELEAHAVKGMGKVHAKWSPVSTAWYRMLPEIIIKKEVVGDEAEKLVKKCPVKVFDIEDIGNGQNRAVVANPRACTLCRECIRGTDEETIEIRRVKDHFIFTVESAGALPPEELFMESVQILADKCANLLESFQQSFPTMSFPPLPERGDFNLKDVLDSPYFFN